MWLVAAVVISFIAFLLVLPMWAIVDAVGRGRRESVLWGVVIVALWPMGGLLYGVIRARSPLLRAFALGVATMNAGLVWIGHRNQAAVESATSPTIEHYEAVSESDRLRLIDVFGSYGAPGNDDYVQALSLSDDGRRLAVSGGRTLQVWDVEERSVVETFESLPANDILAGWVHGKWLGRAGPVAISADGGTVAAARGSVTIRLGMPLFTFARNALLGGGHVVDTWSPDGTRLSLRAHGANATWLRLTHGRLFSASYDGTIAEWETRDGRELHRIDTNEGWIVAAAVSPDARVAVVSARKPYGATSASGHLGLWDLSTGSPTLSLLGHEDRAHAVAFTDDGSRIMSASFDGFRIWSTSTGTELRFVPGNDAVYDVTFSADGRYALSGSANLYLWDLERGEVVERLPFERADDEAAASVFSRDGAHVIVGTARGAILRFRLGPTPLS